jgi:hypothetical protein
VGGVLIIDGDRLAIALTRGYHEEEVLDMKNYYNHCNSDVHIKTALFQYLVLLFRVFGISPASHVLKEKLEAIFT